MCVVARPSQVLEEDVTVPAVLALADGTIFRGQSIGAAGNTTGEVVFNTAITGYQEILTDPSYARQIVTLTYPHIGNTGTTPEDMESAQIYAAGLVIRDLSHCCRAAGAPPNRCRSSCERGRVVAIAGIDTRRLTRLLREKGAQSGCIMTGEQVDESGRGERRARISRPQGHGSGQGRQHARAYQWNDGSIWPRRRRAPIRAQQRLHVVAYDYGIKRNILRLLADRAAASRWCRRRPAPAKCWR